MSFPRQHSEWVNIWGQEWHFCNSAAHNGSFVNNEWQSDGTMRIRFLLHARVAHFIFYLSPNSIFALQASMEVLAVFHVFGSFSSFLCTFDSTHWGFYVLNSFSCLGSSFCGFYRLGTTPINGVFTFIYDSTVLHSIEALKSLFLLLNCIFRIHKLGFLIFDVLVQI